MVAEGAIGESAVGREGRGVGGSKGVGGSDTGGIKRQGVAQSQQGTENGGGQVHIGGTSVVKERIGWVKSDLRRPTSASTGLYTESSSP